MHRYRGALSFLMTLAVGAFPAHADGDPARGAHNFTCIGCHVVASDHSWIGPSLQGIVGRPAATRPGYIYSTALNEAGERGLVWTEADLADFIRAPRGKAPGTKCFHRPMTDDQKIADIIAYLKSVPKP